ncbi:hypothetical protein MINTM015_39940 [Mycobacterium paraintracellulare]|nr:hypothetical protein MINTM015_39940 [Mycobacterium paraintracellulare]
MAHRPVVPADPKAQTRPVGPGEVEALAIVDVDGPYPVTIDENAGGRTVVDRDPFGPVEAKQEVGSSDQRMGDAHVGAEVTSDHDVVARRETAL